MGYFSNRYLTRFRSESIPTTRPSVPTSFDKIKTSRPTPHSRSTIVQPSNFGGNKTKFDWCDLNKSKQKFQYFSFFQTKQKIYATNFAMTSGCI